MEFLFLLLPMASLIISYKYHIAHKRLIGTGKVPKIIYTRNMTTLFRLISALLVVSFLFYELSFFS